MNWRLSEANAIFIVSIPEEPIPECYTTCCPTKAEVVFSLFCVNVSPQFSQWEGSVWMGGWVCGGVGVGWGGVGVLG